MADTCLLIIHLELRVHCFFHLLPLARVRPSLPHDELDNEVGHSSLQQVSSAMDG
uniref:Uncharacterized protein n=1 Tax=Parascaris equorum TaxID=6256 RepID=A0A914SFF2_PAREQ